MFEPLQRSEGKARYSADIVQNLQLLIGHEGHIVGMGAVKAGHEGVDALHETVVRDLHSGRNGEGRQY